MNDHENANRATMERWYNEMWGKTDSSKIKDFVAPEYLRHDVTGANNIVTVESYTAMTKAGMDGKVVNDFTYVTIVEGDFIGTFARYAFGDGEQWDWVQLFRLENGRLLETWLPGMGGTETRGYPKPEDTWLENTVPDQNRSTMSAAKNTIRAWFEHLAAGTDATDYLCQSVRSHDMNKSDIELDASAFQSRWRSLMQNDTASGLKLFVIEEHDLAIATGMWTLGEDKREWNWVQAFRLKDGKIAQSWITSIGGTDASIVQSPEIRWERSVLPENATRFGVKVAAKDQSVQK